MVGSTNVAVHVVHIHCGTKLVYFYQSELELTHVQGYPLEFEGKIVGV